MVSSDHIGPNETGRIRATVKTDGKKGRILKTVQVETNDPVRPLVVLKLRANVIDAFHEKPLQPDAIFRSPCRKCHLDRGRDQMGAALFRADCIMCHMRGKSAPSISSLKKLSRERLKEAIEEGVPDSMMPGFSWRVGGPLTEAQIRSLLKYIKGR